MNDLRVCPVAAARRSDSRVLVALVLTVIALLAGCSQSSDEPQSQVTDALTGHAIVFAAASLTETFTALAKNFEAAHPGTRVTLSFGGSSTLATQINAGAPADVFAAASTKTMNTVVKAGLAKAPTDFASNTMEIAAPPANPGHVTDLRDLAAPSLKVAICQNQVPCGKAAVEVFTKSGITVHPVTFEPDVKSVLSKVELGSVDAGIVYVTDVRAAGAKVIGIGIASADNATTHYPITVTQHGASNPVAAVFVAYVLSPAGQRVLHSAGFSPA